jgi:hypothetical protein
MTLIWSFSRKPKRGSEVVSTLNLANLMFSDSDLAYLQSETALASSIALAKNI